MFDIDIANKLFPNILTLLTQLGATGVIYLLYRKYLHGPVMDYLDTQAEELDEAQNLADEVEEKALAKEKELELEYQRNIETLERSEKALKRESQKQRDEILQQAKERSQRMIEQSKLEIEKEKQAMLIELEDYVLETAVSVAEKALENYSYEEEEIYNSLELELEQMHNETD